MTEETAKALIDALNRFSIALEKLQAGGLGGGINVFHYGSPYQQHPYQQPFQSWPYQTVWPYNTCSYQGASQ